jgi:hypothetical protein
MAYTTIDKPTDYFETKLYTGNASTNNITGLNFQPDWVWLKSRSFAQNHENYDSVRGATKRLYNNLSNAEDTNSTGLTSFNSDGFTLGSSNSVNKSGDTFVSWNWLAGGTASSNTDGSITSTVSANTTAGFSIVSYTGNGTLGATVGHGLGSAPSMVLVKRRNTTGNWWMYHDGLGGADKYIVLNSTSAIGTSTNIWNNTEPTSNVFSLGDNANYPQVNGTSDTFIAYCFAEKKGYSKFSSFVGNGSSSGTFIYTGFRPAFVICKRTDSADNWMMVDNKRGSINLIDEVIFSDLSQAEVSTNACDFLSNGFKARTTSTWINASGGTYIYMAFAENPFVTSTGIPTTAR